MSKQKQLISEWREVWYAWDGDTEDREMSFTKYITGIVFGDGMVFGELDVPMYREEGNIYSLWPHWGAHKFSIVAYTLGEKRRRVECPKYIQVSNDRADRCPKCQGRGYAWERKK